MLASGEDLATTKKPWYVHSGRHGELEWTKKKRSRMRALGGTSLGADFLWRQLATIEMGIAIGLPPFILKLEELNCRI